MPQIDGPTLTRAIRSSIDPVLAATPIVALTADDSEDTRRLCAGVGMNGFISKPVDIEQLDLLFTALPASGGRGIVAGRNAVVRRYGVRRLPHA